MTLMGLENSYLPLFWTGDFIRIEGNQCGYVASEFNASCVGISEFYGIMDGGSFDLIDKELQIKGQQIADMIGKAAVKELINKKNGEIK